MKLKKLIPSLAAVILAAGFGTAIANAGEKTEAELLPQAKVTKAAATKIAVEKVPTGTVKGAELEEEGGKLIWSFDMATPGTADTTEVNVDAKTGVLISVDVEKATDEANEAKKEKGGK